MVVHSTLLLLRWMTRVCQRVQGFALCFGGFEGGGALVFGLPTTTPEGEGPLQYAPHRYLMKLFTVGFTVVRRWTVNQS